MELEFITFKTFNDIALADALAEILERHEIDYQVEEVSVSPNPLMALNDEMTKNYIIKINPGDFIHVNQVLTEEERDDVNAAEPDHYLFNFTDDELMEVLAKADEWSAFDNQLAQKILIGRGVEINDDKLANLTETRLNELKAPEPPQTFWIIMGYIFGLMGGLLGLFIGRHLTTHKKTLPNGQQVLGYHESDRIHGKRIMYLSAVMLLVFIILRLTPGI